MRMLRALAVTFALVANMCLAPAVAQQPAPKPGDTPERIRELIDLLADPGVRTWLETQRLAQDAAPRMNGEPERTASRYVADRIDAIRARLDSLSRAPRDVPIEFGRVATRLSQELDEHGSGAILFLIFGFAALGIGTELIYKLAARRILRQIIALHVDTPSERLRAMGIRLAYGLGIVIAFGVGSVGAFIALDWPPLLRDIVLGYLLAFLAVRLVLIVSRFFLAPGAERFRLLPMDTPAAWFWHWRLSVAFGWLAFSWATIALLAALGFASVALSLVKYALGLVLLAIGLETIWRRPRATALASGTRHVLHGAANSLLSAYLVLLWLLWVVDATGLLWLALIAVVLPGAMGAAHRGVDSVLHPPSDASRAAPGVLAASLGRGIRALLIIGAALLLARAWHLDIVALTAPGTLTTRLMRGALHAAIILLLADFAWHVCASVIDRKLAGVHRTEAGDDEEMQRRARLRTLLPILRNVILIVLLVMSFLMALAALGLEIGPLIAGAGVVGVAIGFGAQTLVKDIISGIFYLLDDAFRIGEYIQTGNYKGEVESFSLRSIKLRHHRGPLYTVPFGQLGAVQNMSRDWVIDKLTLNLTYDADLDKARKLIKQVGKELLQDPELAPHILETLKMQGVDQFGDFAIEVRTKFKTKPGEQFVIRRRAHALIKKAFDANGIRFAFPTVTVAGGGDASAAVARQGLDLIRPPSAAP